MDSANSLDRESLFQFNENTCLCAGAGSGKTSALVKMYLSLIAGDTSFGEPVPIEQIVAITFTEKAAAEMKKRVKEAIERKIVESKEKPLWEERLRGLERAHIKTIHSFCAGILRENPVEAVIDPGFAILDSYEASEILEQIVHQVVMEGLASRDPVVEKLIYDYGFSGYNQVSGLKELLKRLYQEIYSEGLSWDKIDQIRGNNNLRAEKLLSSKMYSLEENMEKLTILIQQGAVKKSAKSFAYIEELIQNYFSITDAPVDELIERGGDLLVLENYIKGNWPVAVRQLKKSLEEIFSKMKEAYYQLLGSEYLDGFQLMLKKVDEYYQAWKLQQGVLDFDDLQIKTRDILKSNRKIRKQFKDRFKIIMLDEFQDTNGMQKEIVYYLSEDLSDESLLFEQDSYRDVVSLHPKKLYMVGDPKQSIYRFRGADVTVFLEMQSELEKEGASGKNISISENFRSHRGIVEFCNRFFSSIMSGGEEMYDVNFDHDDHQECQRESEDEEPRVELIKINKGEGSEQKRKIEASALSRRILEIVQPGSTVLVYEKDENGREKRKPHPDFSDIAILFRRFTHIKLYEQELRRRNIPYYVVKGRGFFGCQEVRDIINFLKYIDGENDDVALVGILRSPLVGISDETLYWLFKGAGNDKMPFNIKFLREQLIKVNSMINNLDIWNIKIFIDVFKELRDKKDRLSPAELIESILGMTHYDSIMLTTFQGEQKVANIRKLIELSRDFARRETSLLRDFTTYLIKLVEEDSIEPEAQTSLENANVVKLMTIHQAKGLEFPVVFLPDIGHTIRQVSDRILFDETKGLALRLYQDSKGTYQSTMVYEEIRKLHNKREYAESKRLFYVAATRARDYLVLSGEKPKRVGSACWRVWLDQFLEVHPDELVCVVQEEDISELTPNEVKNLYQRDQGYQKLGEVKVEKDESSQELAGNILQQSCFRRESSVEEFSITVTALSEYMVCPQRFYYTQYLGLDEKAVSEIRGNDKSFSKGRDETIHSLSKLEKGNLVHLILKHTNFQLDTDKKSKEIDGMLLGQGVSSRRDDVEELRNNILAFLNSDLGITLSRIREEHIFREIPFMFKLQEHDYSFTVVVQGVIDLLYRDFEGVWTVVDYKYSYGRAIDRERYKIQLMAYALSVSKMMKEDKVNVIIKVMGKKDMPPQECCLEEIDLKNFEQQVIAAAQEIAKKQMMSDPVLWTRKESEDCKRLDCVYWKRCNA